MGYRRDLKPLLTLTLLALLLIGGACAVELSESNTIETEEAVMDPQTEREVQMLMDAFPEGEHCSETFLFSLTSIKNNSVGAFVTIERVSDEEITEIDIKRRIAIKLDIVDDTGTRYRVGFTEEGLAINLSFPPSYTESVRLPLPPIE